MLRWLWKQAAYYNPRRRCVEVMRRVPLRQRHKEPIKDSSFVRIMHFMHFVRIRLLIINHDPDFPVSSRKHKPILIQPRLLRPTLLDPPQIHKSRDSSPSPPPLPVPNPPRYLRPQLPNLSLITSPSARNKMRDPLIIIVIIIINYQPTTK